MAAIHAKVKRKQTSMATKVVTPPRSCRSRNVNFVTSYIFGTSASISAKWSISNVLNLSGIIACAFLVLSLVIFHVSAVELHPIKSQFAQSVTPLYFTHQLKCKLRKKHRLHRINKILISLNSALDSLTRLMLS